MFFLAVVFKIIVQKYAANEGNAVMGSVRQLASVTFKVQRTVLYCMLAS